MAPIELPLGPTPNNTATPDGTSCSRPEAGAATPFPSCTPWHSPSNPYNWPSRKQNLTLCLAGAMTFLTPLVSTLPSHAIPQILTHFHTPSPLLGSLTVSIFLLGFAMAPLLLSPLSELYGRRIVYNATNLLFVVFMIACAVSPSIGCLIAMRFFAGCAGSAGVVLGWATVVDTVAVERRGGVMAVFAAGVLVGPTVGPGVGVAGGVAVGVWWWMPETYAPVLQGVRGRGGLREAMRRPVVLLCCSPVVALMSLHMAVVYGLLFLMFTTFPMVFQEGYGISTGMLGVAYLGLGVGFFTGLVIFGLVSDRIAARRTLRSGIRKPEYRLPPMVWGTALIPVGLTIYGWTADKRTHWIFPILGTVVVGLGDLLAMIPVLMYMMGAWPLYSASALAACAVMRSILGAVIPLGGGKLFERLGLGPGNMVLAGVGCGLPGVAVALEKWGEILRGKYEIVF